MPSTAAWPGPQSERAAAVQEAQRLAAQGDFAAAESIYDSILQADAGNLEARLGRGHTRAWRHDYRGAKEDFQAVLTADAGNISAQNGLGYTAAWSGDYGAAQEHFRRILALVPGQWDAAKGLAFVALWRGDFADAVQLFGELAQQRPSDPEIQVALGQAHYGAGHIEDARKAFERVLELDPGNAAARQGLENSRSGGVRRTVVDLQIWGGPSFFRDPLTGSGTSAGLRFAELGVSPVRNLRLYFQFDNGLTLDNPAISLADNQVPTYYGGGMLTWKKNYLTRFDVGHRELPGSVGQTLYRAEQVFFLPRSYVFKVGGWLGPREDHRTEWLTSVAIGIPVAERFRMEPTFFYSRTGLPGERQWRILIPGEYSFSNGWRIGAGAAGGQAFTTPASVSDGVFDGFVHLSAPVGRVTRTHVLVRHERIGSGNSITVLSFGLSFAFAGR